ncbi:hypothetical protein HPB48_004223 [Haemaphysalis longicornis]|uniref:Concentrative nucleoside transporter C-terminal domain-containing protein n=1 Tax=Haemaphysalis longicornis TaxID=44386 RepID=A0A9J6GD29_HAELO|nr:hypothetical protein HPB48_004223 [Haemaphysalis longicornis]
MQEQSAVLLHPYLPYATKAELHCFRSGLPHAGHDLSACAVPSSSHVSLAVIVQRHRRASSEHHASAKSAAPGSLIRPCRPSSPKKNVGPRHAHRRYRLIPLQLVPLHVDTRHLVTAAVLAAPSALLFSKLLYPETEQLRIVTVRIYTHRSRACILPSIHCPRSTDTSVLEAGAKGAMACLGVVGGIVANIVAFMAMIHFLDAVFKWAAGILGLRGVTFQTILGKAFTPLALGMGVPWKDCADVGEVIGVKVVANEFIAYTSLVDKRLDARSTMLATYALSGFGNVCSVGIMLGTLAALCPKRLPEASEVAFRALWAGCSASILSACVAGAWLCTYAPRTLHVYGVRHG